MKIDSKFLTVFEYHALTKIHGEPDYASLKRLKEQLKANANKIISNLGGGNHGYLGLVLDNAEYNAIPGTVLFVAPGYPPVLAIPATATPVEALQLCKDNQEAKHEF